MEFDIIAQLGWIVIAGTVFAYLGKLIRMPTIVVYIFAGLLLGPITGILDMDYALELISELGIALLLFLVGLELSLNKIRDVGKVALAAGIGQVVFTAAFGFVICWLLGFELMESLFLATALTFSSTVVVVKLLDQKGDLDSLYGRIAVGIFLVQDLVVVIFLTVLAGLARGGEAATMGSILQGVGMAFAGMILLLVGILLAARWILPKPFSWAARNPDLIFVWAIAWCFLIVLAAEGIGLSLEIGAFLAGLSLAQLPYNDDLRRRVHPLMNFFIAVFFVTLGIQMEFGEAAAFWKEAIVLSVFVLIGNPLIFMLIITRMGYAEKTAFFTSVTVAQISEFSFIFAAMGVASGLIGSSILSVTALVGVITIAVSAYMIIYNAPLYAFCRKLKLLKMFGANQVDDEKPPEKLENHVIVIGMNYMGRCLVKDIHKAGYEVLAIDNDPGKLFDLPGHQLIGNFDYHSVQEASYLESARLVVSALQIEDANTLIAYRCQQCGVPCAIHGFDQTILEDLLELNTGFILTPKLDGMVTQRGHLKEEGF
ncbi:MAG: cation:proton antiporter [Opitutales bacterium]|nr:cation:proton antiporter [Opitutales bacterium]